MAWYTSAAKVNCITELQNNVFRLTHCRNFHASPFSNGGYLKRTLTLQTDTEHLNIFPNDETLN